MRDYKTVKVSRQAYDELNRIRYSDTERYRGRGLVGVVDDVLLHRFSTEGRGKSPKKLIDKSSTS